MAPRLSSLTALLASNCTLRCAYCYQQPGGSLLMPWPALRAALDVLLRSSSPSVVLEFSGGEPLLASSSIARAVRYVERTRGARDVRYELTTNGTLLDPARLDFLDAHDFAVNLSYHPVPGERDRRNQASFWRLDRLLDRLREHSQLWRDRLHIAVTVGTRELPHLAETVRYLMRKELRDIGISAAFGQPGSRARDIARIEQQFARITRLVLAHRERTGYVPLSLYRKSPEDTVEVERGSSTARRRFGLRDLRCSGARGTAIAVDPTGEAWGCVMLAGTRPLATTPEPSFTGRTDAPRGRSAPALRLAPSSPLWLFRLGDVRDESFTRHLRSYASRVTRTGLFARRRTQCSGYARCGNCRFLDRCPLCPVGSAFGPDAADTGRVSDFVCAFTRVSQAHAERFPPGPTLVNRLKGRAPVPVLVSELRRYAQRVRAAP
jgi:sulfatase maturation enzyme AslB (radical SAM superfamily)